MQKLRAKSKIPILLSALVLGGTGFAAGFFGPIALNPDANQGPLVGLLITGPFGALAGVVLGTVLRFLPVTDTRRLQALGVLAALFGVGTLYYCLPEPAIRGYVIDAEVEDCAPPARSYAAALTRWQSAVERTTFATPPAGWQETARRNIERDGGVVLTLRIAQRRALYEHRKPWNAGKTAAGPWVAVNDAERYYARDQGRDCAAYRARGRALYLPYDASGGNPNEPAPVWPPTDTTGFLSLLELQPVPQQYRRLLD